MIEVRNLDKSFGSKHVLKDITATFEKGKSNLVIGASGSGKTTLIKCIVGLETPENGEILFDGVNFLKMKQKEKRILRQDIGFLFQNGALFDSQTVAENLIFGLSVFSNQTRIEMEARAKFCLERVNLPDAGKLYPAELSGGMRKRVAIARAIAMKPKYLFCDEPNSGLDPQTANLIDQLIEDLTTEYQMTTIVITHDMNSVIEIGDNIIFNHQGEKWWEGNKDTILTTDNQKVVDFVYASQFMKQIKKNYQK